MICHKLFFARAVHSGVTMTVVFFNNWRLAYGSLNRFENNQLELVARLMKTHTKKSLGNSRSVSLLTPALNFKQLLQMLGVRSRRDTCVSLSTC